MRNTIIGGKYCILEKAYIYEKKIQVFYLDKLHGEQIDVT